MNEIINKMAGSRVLVVGDIMLDRYWVGDTGRISPEAPVPVVKMEKQNQYPGGAGNVARNIAALSGHVQLIGMIGDDAAGDELKRTLESPNILFDPIVSKKNQTITKLRVVSSHQQLLRLDFEDEDNAAPEEDLLKKISSHLDDIDVLLLSDYAKGVLSNPQTLIQKALDKNIKVLVDPKGNDFSKYQGAYLLTPNRQEFENVAGPWKNLDELASKARAMMKEHNLNALLITLGPDGMVLVEKDSFSHIPAFTEEVYDVTGAGDTVISVLAVAISRGFTNYEAMELANLAASLVVRKFGAATISLDELRSASLDHSLDGIINMESLLSKIEDHKARGKKIVMTNGCFDIVHAGHISYLKEAKSLGDILIVALNSDESVTRLKGEGRPIHKLKHRQQVIAELQSVDYVISFNEDTPIDIISKILPDILVKGGDYTIETIVGAKEVIANGGKVKVLNFEDNLSTTNIISKLY